MANALTGEFDIVTEFSISTVNRVLAAMHRAERFAHSMAMRVDDTPPHRKGHGFSVLGSVDAFGDPTVDPTKIGPLVPVSGQLTSTDLIFKTLDPVVNPELIGATIAPIVPSNLKGVAQLQLSPPTIDVADASGSNVTVGMQVMGRYSPDPNTSPLREFVRGKLQITAPVSQVASQSANVIDINLKVDAIKINFTPAPSTPLSAEDLAGITQLIRNALKTSFLPSTNPLPPDIHYLKFKTLLGAPNTIAVLLNMGDVSGNPASMTNIFLGTEDDFAFAAGRDFIIAAFDPVINSILNQPLAPVKVHVPILGDATYTVSLNSAAIDLQNGKIVLTIEGHAHTPQGWAPDFDFTVKQDFSLRVDGATADLVVGDIFLDTSSWIVNLFKGRALGGIRSARDAALAQQDADGLDAYGKVNRLLSAERNLGGFLNSLLKPAEQAATQPQEDLTLSLTYTSVDIQPSGIVLHGSLAVPDWPPPHVEFEQISATTGPHHLSTGPNYSALKSWIPGGAIQRYEWSRGQAPPFNIDENTFVLIQIQLPTHSVDVVSGDVASQPVSVDTVSHPAVVGFTPLCLTVRGTRLSASGPVPEESVSATFCDYSSFPVLSGFSTALGREAPLVALTQPGPGGLVQVTGHASARPDGAGKDTPNLIVHFANEQTAGHLDLLTQALGESRRENAPTAILVVLPTKQLATARHSEGVIYTEEQGGAWERVFGVKIARRPLTLIVGPKGDALWQHEGELDSGMLAAALHRVLVKSGPVRPSMLRLSLRIGSPAPNFLFENAPGRQLTLRKLERRPVELVFWKSSSMPSIEMVRDRQERGRKAGAHGPVVLAINVGDASELAKKIAAEHGLSATLVTDPERNISRAYGVNIWPTTVVIDAFGVVREIHYGRLAGENRAHPPREKGAAAL